MGIGENLLKESLLEMEPNIIPNSKENILLVLYHKIYNENTKKVFIVSHN